MQTTSPSPFSSETHLLQLARRGKPRLSPGLDRWLYPWLSLFYALISPIIVGILVAVPLVFIFMLGGYSLDSLTSEISGVPAGPGNFIITLYLLLSFFPIYFLIWAWILLFERRHLWTVGFEWQGALWKYLRGFLFGLLLIVASVVMAAFTGLEFDTLLARTSDPGGMLLGLAGIAIILIGWIVQGAAEEVLTRGFLLPIFGVRYGIPIAILVSSILFSALHLFNDHLSWIALLNLALFGVFACLYALREGGLWGICALHTSWNWAQGNLLGFPVSGTSSGSSLLSLTLTGPDWWAGGPFGPEGGFAVSLVLILGCAALLIYHRSPS